MINCERQWKKSIKQNLFERYIEIHEETSFVGKAGGAICKEF